MRRERETFGLAFFRWLRDFIIGGFIVILGCTWLYQKGVFNDPFWTNAKNDILNSEIFNFTKGESISLLGKASDTLDSVSKKSRATSSEISISTSNSETKESSVADSKASSSSLTYTPLKFSKKRQLVLGDFDNLGRATYGHIQLNSSQEPSNKRENKINFNPVGWHNYKFSYIDSQNGQKKKAWLMNRGHLIGYQFSGLNSEGKNIVPMTRYLNAGTISDKKMDKRNPYGMLFYEIALDNWLEKNPDNYLDYEVIPNYTGEELIPRTVTLYWTGFNKKGKQINVKLTNSGNATTKNLISSVRLDNSSENASIDYSTGMATTKK